MTQPDVPAQLREEGFRIFPSVLPPAELERARAGLERGVGMMRQMVGTTHIASLDPNASNIRVMNLPAVDPVFIDLLTREDAMAGVEAVLGSHVLVSNFTANVALPGSGSMKLHSDQALVVPPPWLHPWALNVIWCLDDVDEANGATRYLPGSHRLQSFEDLPPDAMERTLPFEAPAGSFIVMEGRLWHTSGRNVTADRRRRMLFAYYSSDFIRQQVNWSVVLPREVQAGMDERTRALFGLGPMGNARIGGQLTNLAA